MLDLKLFARLLLVLDKIRVSFDLLYRFIRDFLLDLLKIHTVLLLRPQESGLWLSCPFGSWRLYVALQHWFLRLSKSPMCSQVSWLYVASGHSSVRNLVLLKVGQEVVFLYFQGKIGLHRSLHRSLPGDDALQLDVLRLNLLLLLFNLFDNFKLLSS